MPDIKAVFAVWPLIEWLLPSDAVCRSAASCRSVLYLVTACRKEREQTDSDPSQLVNSVKRNRFLNVLRLLHLVPERNVRIKPGSALMLTDILLDERSLFEN